MSIETLEVNTTNYILEVTNGTTQTLEVTEGVTLDLLLSEMGLQGPDGPAGPEGKSITSVVKTSTVGLVDTYTITFNDSTTQTFTVTNGAEGIVKISTDPDNVITLGSDLGIYAPAVAAIHPFLLIGA